MAQDDPFGLNDPERTRIARPQPGGRGPGIQAAVSVARPGSGAPLPEGTNGRGPLVQAAFGLLMLAPRLRSRLPPSDPALLRQRVEAELARYEDRAHGRGVDGRLVRTGHYALCALIDDSVLNTPWGAHGAWKSESLAGTLHHDVAAGERFFDVLDQARRAPERQRPLMELLAACLAMGFEGRYRLAPGGSAMLAGMREDLLRQLGGSEPDELSPHWQGVVARHTPLAERIPLWVYATAGLVIAAILHTGFHLRLGGYADRLGPLVAALPPAPPVDIVRSGPASAAAPANLQVTTVGPALAECLRAAGLPSDGVSEDFQKVRVRLPSAGLFNSGRADLNASFRPLLGCLGRALADEPGRVLVVGHTDSVPIRSARFPSNWELSKARAESVRTVLAQAVGDPGRVATDGRADTEPVASNSDEAGRALNRRVELLLLK
jgi:type VI secretion system protein ImpK